MVNAVTVEVDDGVGDAIQDAYRIDQQEWPRPEDDEGGKQSYQRKLHDAVSHPPDHIFRFLVVVVVQRPFQPYEPMEQLPRIVYLHQREDYSHRHLRIPQCSRVIQHLMTVQSVHAHQRYGHEGITNEADQPLTPPHMPLTLQVQKTQAQQPYARHKEQQVHQHALCHPHLPEVQRVLQQELNR